MDYYGEPYGDFESHSLRQCYQLEPRQVDQAKVEAATNQWRQSPQYPGEGNFRFFNYALALRAAGMNLAEIENKLESEAEHGRSPKKRGDQIPSIIASLKHSWRRAG